MGLLKWLKGIFGSVDLPPHDYRDSPLVFKELDVARMQKRWDLAEEAKKRGTQNMPPADQDTLDDVENKVITAIQGEAVVAHDILTSHLRAYSDRLGALKIGTHLAQLLNAADAARTDFIVSARRGRDLLFQLFRDVVGIREEYERFREQHGIRRLPNYPTSRLWHWGVLLILVLVEAFLNGNLLARGLVLGILGGVTYALIIAVINVGLGVLAGRVAIPNLLHVRRWRKAMAIVGLAIWLCFAFLFNLTVAHYRSALGGQNPEAAERIAITELLESPLAIPEVSGWLLFVLGISFSFIAAFDGWKMDDPYPGFGPLARRRYELNQEYVEQKEQLTYQLEEIRDEAKSKMKALAGEVEMRADQHSGIQNKRLHCIELFHNHHKYLEQCANELLSAYRHANRMARTSEPPAHFSRPWELPPVEVEDAKIHGQSGHSFLERQLELALGQLATVERSIDEAYQAALSEFKSLEELSEEGGHRA